MNNNQIMIYMLIKKREEIKSDYYYQKNKLLRIKAEPRKQEFQTITNVYLSDLDFIASQLKHYREKEKRNATAKAI